MSQGNTASKDFKAALARVLDQGDLPHEVQEIVDRVAKVLKRIAKKEDDQSLQERAGFLVGCAWGASSLDTPFHRKAGTKGAQNSLVGLAAMIEGIRRHIGELPKDALDALREVSTLNDRDSIAIFGGQIHLTPEQRHQLDLDILALCLRSRFASYDDVRNSEDAVIAAREIPWVVELASETLPRLATAIERAIQHLDQNPTEQDGPRKEMAAAVTCAAAEAYERLSGLPISRTRNSRPASHGNVEPFRDVLTDLFNILGFDENTTADGQIVGLQKRRRSERRAKS